MSITIASYGTLIESQGSALKVAIPLAGLGDYCEITNRDSRKVRAEVIAVSNGCALLSPFDSPQSISIGDPVYCAGRRITVSLPTQPLGLVLNAFGYPLSTQDAPQSTVASIRRDIFRSPPDPTSRIPLNYPVQTGIKVLDTVLPLAQGQRIGLFASAGCGKSTLLSMIAKNIEADVRVIGLIGERGREVREFIEELGQDTLDNTVVVVATSDEPPMKRMLAAYTAMTIAELFREQGNHVLLLMDSLTRYARAARDVGLAAGELPVRQGYPPSVYGKLPELLERAGTDNRGAITAIFTILTNQDGTEDPLADEIRSLLDGHIYLSSTIANQGIRPAVDLSRSVSRVNNRVLTMQQQVKQRELLRLIARWQTEKDFLLFGGIPDPELRQILNCEHELRAFLNQLTEESFSRKDSFSKLDALLTLLKVPTPTNN